MRPDDVRNIIFFNTRMSMFVCPSDRANVVAFLHGYEYAAGGGCEFTKELSRHLESRYRIKCYATGWPDQVDRLAERQSMQWMEVYLLVSSEVLSVALKCSGLQAAGRAKVKRERTPPRKQRGKPAKSVGS
jgi:hypothetical protein